MVRDIGSRGRDGAGPHFASRGLKYRSRAQWCNLLGQQCVSLELWTRCGYGFSAVNLAFMSNFLLGCWLGWKAGGNIKATS